MTAVASVIVCCGTAGRWLYTTVRSLAAQSVPAEIILVTEPSTPPGTRSWVEALARRHGWSCVASHGSTRAEVVTSGVTAATAEHVCIIDAGDVLTRDAIERLTSALGDSAAGWATAWRQDRGPGERSWTVAPADTGALGLMEEGASGPLPWMFRRADWVRLGGFDPMLLGLTEVDFRLRLLAEDRPARVVQSALLIRQWRLDGRYRDRWSPEDRPTARLVERHLPLLAREPAALLGALERSIEQAAEDYRHELAHRDQSIAERDQLEARAAALRPLADSLRDPLFAGGGLRRTSPVTLDWGYGRGTPIDRVYIEQFLSDHAEYVRGRVLEVSESAYTNRFGGTRVTHSDVLDVEPANPQATVIADLRDMANVADATYDCIILTQTLHVIDDADAVVRECARILAPDGVVLATLPCASRIVIDYGDAGDFSRVTGAGATRLFQAAFDPRDISVRTYGNALSTSAFLYGLADRDLAPPELSVHEPYVPLLATVCARKPLPSSRSRTRARQPKALVLRYYRFATDAGDDPHQLTVSPTLFRSHLETLRARCDVLPLDALVSAATAGLSRDTVAITFDDGYREVLTEAAPLLSSLGLPATFFVTTGKLGSGDEYWWDALARLLGPSRAPRGPVTITLPGGRVTLPLATADEIRAAHWRLYHALVGATAEAQQAAVAQLADVLDDHDAPRWTRLTSTELGALSKIPGLTIGAHTAQHTLLTATAPEIRQQELAAHLSTLALMGLRPAAFAYPFGAADDTVVADVRHAGFTLAVTCDEQPVGAATDPLLVPRYEVTPARARRFEMWLDGVLD